jgi:Domain of unknown function (DUF4247)
VDAVRAARPLAGLLAGAALLLSGCGMDDGVRGHIDDAYDLQGTSGDTATYLATAPVAATSAEIAGAVPPAARAADAGSEYLRYEDDIVIVSAAPSGSTVRVEDLDENYRSGHYRHLGPGFDPGSPAGADTDGGPGDEK